MYLFRKHMDAASLEFWDEKLPSFKGFMYSGSSGWLAYFLFRVVFPALGFGWIRRDLAAGEKVLQILDSLRCGDSLLWACFCWHLIS